MDCMLMPSRAAAAQPWTATWTASMECDSMWTATLINPNPNPNLTTPIALASNLTLALTLRYELRCSRTPAWGLGSGSG